MGNALAGIVALYEENVVSVKGITGYRRDIAIGLDVVVGRLTAGVHDVSTPALSSRVRAVRPNYMLPLLLTN
jgi:hypothetical protein